jgi:hypothetical protein
MSSDGRTCRRPPAFRRGTVGATEDGPAQLSQSRIDPPAAGRCDGCHAAASWSSAPTTSRSTRFSHDATARAWPLTATAAAGMATSWRTGGSTSNQDRAPTHGQRSARSPDSPSACQTRHRMPLGRHLPTAPGQRSRSRLRATRCLTSRLNVNGKLPGQVRSTVGRIGHQLHQALGAPDNLPGQHRGGKVEDRSPASPMASVGPGVAAVQA